MRMLFDPFPVLMCSMSNDPTGGRTSVYVSLENVAQPNTCRAVHIHVDWWNERVLYHSYWWTICQSFHEIKLLKRCELLCQRFRWREP